MRASRAYLIQILVPKKTGSGRPVGREWFDAFLRKLTQKFGGATSFARNPAEGLWQDGDQTQQDSIAVVEVMTEELDAEFWQSVRVRLEEELLQEEIVLRVQEIIKL
jgi:hypothetical protein